MNLSLRQNGLRKNLFKQAVAVLCILLVLVVGAAHLLHVHPATTVGDAGCALCVVAHLSTIASPSVSFAALLTIAEARLPELELVWSGRFHIVLHNIRPPPTSTLLV